MDDVYTYRDEYCQSNLDDLYSGKYSDCEGDVLEIGAGPGNWTEYLLAKSNSVDIVEKNNEFCLLLNRKFGNVVTVHCCALDDFEPKKNYDFIVIHNAIQYVSLERVFLLAKHVNAKNIIVSGHGLGFYFSKLMTLNLRNVYHAVRVLLGMNEEYIYNNRNYKGACFKITFKLHR